MAPIIDRVRAATRQELLAILASAITEITIIGRTHYDDENSAIHLRQLNEAIHRLSGHLRDLCDPGKEFTESRAAVVGAVLALLHPSAIDRSLAHAIK
jgi:hypothetical protein